MNGTVAPVIPEAGRLGFLSQSGALGIALLARAASMGLGLLFIAGAVMLYRRADRRTALRLYLFSLGYLALLFAAMVLDAKL